VVKVHFGKTEHGHGQKQGVLNVENDQINDLPKCRIGVTQFINDLAGVDAVFFLFKVQSTVV